MENVAEILQAVDSPWPFLALAMLGFFALAWRFGKEIISLLHETRETTKDVQKSIITNHGSSNIGDAVDRITGWWMDAKVQDEEDRRLMRLLTDNQHHISNKLDQHIERLDVHIEESAPIRELVQELHQERKRLTRAAQH